MNRNDTIEELLTAQALFERPKSPMTVLQFTDRVRQLLDNTDDAEPTRCAACLAGAIHDSDIGTTGGDGGQAIINYKGDSLCLDHYRKALKQTSSTRLDSPLIGDMQSYAQQILGEVMRAPDGDVPDRILRKYGIKA